jgi:DNA-binding NarL/FixJ family response regulator
MTMDNPRILIVDDDVDFVQALQAALEANSCNVVTASNRKQAEMMVRSREPDLIVLGPIAPRGDPFLFHQWVKQALALRHVSLMVINAPPEKQLTRGWRLEEGLQCDAEDFLSKPVDPMALVPRIQSLLERAEARKIRVLIVDDHAVVRDGIRAVLALQKDMQVVGEAADGQIALDMAARLLPDVVLMDVVMPVMDGLEATRRICQTCDRTKVLVLTQYDDQENIKASLDAGALGFVPKAAASSRLLTGIRAVSRGEDFIRSLLL